MDEYCETCDRETHHEVAIEIREEAPADTPDDRAAFSREPYRVTTCTACGAERSQRMNNGTEVTRA